MTYALSLGITPAHAGLTSILWRYENMCRDHPRACGAYDMYKRGLEHITGSPPRMRGLLYDEGFSRIGCGITPAHAGLTRSADAG